MSSRTARKLKRAKEEQKTLEDEFQRLKEGKDPKNSCSAVIKFVQQVSQDKMLDEDNPYIHNDIQGCTCIIL